MVLCYRTGGLEQVVKQKKAACIGQAAFRNPMYGLMSFPCSLARHHIRIIRHDKGTGA